MKILKITSIFFILSILTQVGGIIYLLYKPIGRFIEQKHHRGLQRFVIKFIVFSLFFCGFSLLIIPPIAKQFGRVALPVYSTKNFPIKPATVITCLANRHYVKPELLSILKQVAKKNKSRGLIYLDANFPFFDGFPLLPHKSHSDGKKVDIAFYYIDTITKKPINQAPTFLGYGYSEMPKEREYNQPQICANKGYWQYNLLKKITKQNRNHLFDGTGTKQLLIDFIKSPSVKKIFIEPHLKQRLGLQKESKIRFHGCGAIRHDDHIHIQL